MTADPTRRLSSMDVLGRDERELVLSGWSGAGVGAPVGVAPQLLAAAVAADPDAVAVIDGDRVMSYRDLDEWSTRLARKLIGAGVGPERAVGVAMDRSAELVVAWWAVVKAGGVYVPVDLAHPVERIATVLEAAGAVCVLVRGADTVAAAGGRPVLHVDGPDVSGLPVEPITDADRAGGAGGSRHRIRHLHLRVHRHAQGRGGQPRRSTGLGCGAAGHVRVDPRCSRADGRRADLRCVGRRTVAGDGIRGDVGGRAEARVRR